MYALLQVQRYAGTCDPTWVPEEQQLFLITESPPELSPLGQYSEPVMGTESNITAET